MTTGSIKFLLLFPPVCTKNILWNAPSAMTKPNQAKPKKRKRNTTENCSMGNTASTCSLCVWAAVEFGFRAGDRKLFLFLLLPLPLPPPLNSIYRQATTHTRTHTPLSSPWLHYLLAQRRGPSTGELYLIRDGIILLFPYICFTRGILAWNEKIIGL